MNRVQAIACQFPMYFRLVDEMKFCKNVWCDSGKTFFISFLLKLLDFFNTYKFDELHMSLCYHNGLIKMATCEILLYFSLK